MTNKFNVLQTLKTAVTNYGLTNKDVTTYGLSIFGVVVVNDSYVAHMKSKGYPIHKFFGRHFFYCFLTRTY
jgi:hypothetical protein